MSQTDLNVANASGATVRADINDHLGALASLSAGATAPTTTFPNQWWFDEANNLLKQRNTGNTAWIIAAAKDGSGWRPYWNGALLDAHFFVNNVSATSRILGRITAGSGDAEELTGAQATTLLDVFTDALKGLAPASGGGTTNFLRADGTWVKPASGGATAVLKTADESVTSSTTLQNDDHLVFAMEANKTYSFRLMLIFVSASSTANLKSGWTVPTGATMFWGPIGASGNWDHGNSSTILLTESDTVIGSTGGGNTQGLIAEGIVRNGANAGNFQLQWAQNSSSASAVTVKEGSNLVVRELGAT